MSKNSRSKNRLGRKLNSRSKHKIKQQLIYRDGRNCYWCQQPLYLYPQRQKNRNKWLMTLDHIILHCIGGPDTNDNLVLADFNCNRARARLFENGRKLFIILNNTKQE